MKILLVEDDGALRFALNELLLREGYEVAQADSVCAARGSRICAALAAGISL